MPARRTLPGTAIANILSIRLYYSAFLLIQALSNYDYFLTTICQKTKIVATIGPGSESKENFAKLLKAGVDIARTNMSHDDQTIHQARIENIRAVSKEENIPVDILVDLSGPKIRIGDFEDVSIELVPGSRIYS